MKQRNKPTDLEQVKILADMFLNLDIVKTKSSPVVIQHPFFNHGFTLIKEAGESEGRVVNIVENEADFKLVKREKKKRINQAKSFDSILSMIIKPYKLDFIKYALDYVSSADLGKALATSWSLVEYTSFHSGLRKDEIVKIFRRADKTTLMTEEERSILENWDENTPIYRGVTDYNIKQTKGLSWTTNIKVARYFASRYKGKGYVYQAYIKPKDILAYFANRAESELVVNYKGLIDVTLKENTTQE